MKTEEKNDIDREINEQGEIFVATKKNIASIEELFQKQQCLIAAYSFRIEKKEQIIDSLKLKAEEYDKLEASSKESLAGKEFEINQLKNKNANKEQIINQQKANIREKEEQIQKVENDSKEYNVQIKKQQDFLDSKRNREKQVCEEFIDAFKTIFNQIQKKEFIDSTFSKIGFNDDNFQFVIKSLEKIKNAELNFWDYLEFDISGKLHDLLNTHKIVISKIFRLYLYCLIDKIQQDLKTVLDVDIYCNSVCKIKDLFAFEGIHLTYPALLFDKYRSDLYELEDFNIINQINGNYTNNVEYNKIIDLEELGVKFRNYEIKPKVSKKS